MSKVNGHASSVSSLLNQGDLPGIREKSHQIKRLRPVNKTRRKSWVGRQIKFGWFFHFTLLEQ
ncbi:MAG: hypothetical protein IH899_21965 [Planctomycetes bacterium]|nr:hypothetical protein [Planctomycetota bacterium]